MNDYNENISQPTTEEAFVKTSGEKAKSHGVYLALAFFLGWIGVHDFYARNKKHGLLKIGIFIIYLGFSAFAGITMVSKGFQSGLTYIYAAFAVLNVLYLWITYDLFASINLPWRNDSEKTTLAKILAAVSLVIIIFYNISSFKSISMMEKQLGLAQNSSSQLFTALYYSRCYEKLAPRTAQADAICSCATAVAITKYDEAFKIGLLGDVQTGEISERVLTIKNDSAEIFKACTTQINQ